MMLLLLTFTVYIHSEIEKVCKAMKQLHRKLVPLEGKKGKKGIREKKDGKESKVREKEE